MSALEVLDADVRDALPARPHPRWLDPMKAVRTDDRCSDRDGWLYEPKLDGIRLLLFRDGDEVRLLTRNRKRRNDTFFEVADALRDQRRVSDIVLDAEVVAFEDGVTSFSRLQGRSQLHDVRRIRATGIEVSCHVFDVLHLDGRDLRGLPLLARKRVLAAALDVADPLRLVEHHTGDGGAYWREACAQGWEGVMAKRADAPYRGSRSRDWLKYPCIASQEFVVGGFTDPRGGRSGFGALVVGFWEAEGDTRVLRYAGRVGTGFDEATLRALRTTLDRLQQPTSPFAAAADLPRDGVHWVAPELVAQVRFSEWTRHDRLRHPRFVGMRDDKEPAAVVREDPGS